MAISGSIHAHCQEPQHQARVMFCLSGNAHDLIMVRKTRQEIATGRCTAWFAYADSQSHGKDFRTKIFPSFEDVIALARNMGAECVSLASDDATAAIVEFARKNNIDRAVIHWERPALWNRWFRRAIAQRIIDNGQGFQIELVGLLDRKPNNQLGQVVGFRHSQMAVEETVA